MSKSSRTTPNGDLGGHVMDLAEEDPDLFGTSIVFRRDEEAEQLFTDRNQNRVGKFVSPDSTNTENFPHARLAELRAVDAVDEPAANPGGMFTTGSSRIVADADALLDYALGRSDVEPVMTELSFSPRRVKEWFSRWMERSGMVIVQSAIPSLAGPPSIDDIGSMSEAERKTYAADLLEWCQQQRAAEAVRQVDDAVRSLDGWDREVADRALYG
ncbi:MAG: hypothetical protein IID34_10305 [Planctomycetes bacterium]|nr:hypothetical protein [Planctomycetota bacterium]